MSRRAVVAYPFQSHGRDHVSANDFIAALSMDRGWFDPATAEECLETALTTGLLERTDEDDGAERRVRAAFEYRSVTVPEDLDPDPAVATPRSVFETCVDRLLEAGLDKREAVAGINRLQDDLGLTNEAAALCFARRRGCPVADLARRAREDLLEDSPTDDRGTASNERE